MSDRRAGRSAADTTRWSAALTGQSRGDGARCRLTFRSRRRWDDDRFRWPRRNHRAHSGPTRGISRSASRMPSSFIPKPGRPGKPTRRTKQNGGNAVALHRDHNQAEQVLIASGAVGSQGFASWRAWLLEALGGDFELLLALTHQPPTGAAP